MLSTDFHHGLAAASGCGASPGVLQGRQDLALAVCGVRSDSVKVKV